MKIPKGKGFYYGVSEEALRDYQRLTPWEKLRWLLMAKRFVEKAVPLSSKRFHDAFRRGLI
ncbi:MAG: hypothetical protein HY547_04410 [Elusimicrobia bacterium]|nr:hypothetical protein [Elusimicrobiota bacterium]